MKKIRDILIIVVLSGLVVWAVMNVAVYVHEANVQRNPIVREAETQCVLDSAAEIPPICHPGRAHFSSVAEAQAYLKDPMHLLAVKQRAVLKLQEDPIVIEAGTECVLDGPSAHRATCYFSSPAEAKAYLNSTEHRLARKQRAAQE
ncbi:MAG: hypothetical protein ACLQMO_00555 [Acidobacteriaceae bacterium]